MKTIHYDVLKVKHFWINKNKNSLISTCLFELKARFHLQVAYFCFFFPLNYKTLIQKYTSLDMAISSWYLDWKIMKHFLTEDYFEFSMICSVEESITFKSRTSECWMTQFGRWGECITNSFFGSTGLCIFPFPVLESGWEFWKIC